MNKQNILKAIAICNRLKAGDTKARHISRLFTLLNKYRNK